MLRAMPTLPMGHTLQERYHILHKLAAGGFGAVYVAEDLRLRGRLVAIKELHDVSTASRELFQQEALVLARLEHPGLVHVSDFFEEGRSVYLVMDYIEGEDLLDLAIKADEERRLLAQEQVLSWLLQVCEAVAYLHHHSPPIIHRDIKPNNIRLDTSGRAVLVDFGIAKVGAQAKTRAMAQAVSQGFSPPEQYVNELGTDTRSDIYALGATLYCLLTVSLPPDSLQRLTQQLPLPSIRERNPKVSPEIEELIETAMALHPDQRFQHGGDMLVAAQQALGLPASSLPSRSKPSKTPTIPPLYKPPSPPPAPPPTTCSRCGHPSRPGGRFCKMCGAPIQAGPRCPKCGATNRRSSRFCAHCRNPLASSSTTPPLSPEYHIQEGDRHRQAGRYPKAIEAYASAYALGSKDITMLENLTHCYLEVKSYSQAISLLNRALHLYPSHGKFHAQLAIAYFNMDNVQQGIQALAHACQINPQDKELAQALARVYMQLGRHAQAIPLLENLVQRSSQKWELRVQLCICYILEEQLHKAHSLVQILRRSHPQSIEVIFLRGMISFKKGRLQKALRQFQSVVTKDPKHTLAHYFCGEIYFHREQWGRALGAYKLSAEVNPNDANIHASICLCYLALGRQVEASQAFQRALRLDPNNPLVRRIQQEIKI